MSDAKPKPSAEIVENRPGCPTCTELFSLFQVATTSIVSAAYVARTRGNTWGVLLLDPKELPAKASKLRAMIRASRSFDERKEGRVWMLSEYARIEDSRHVSHVVFVMPLRELRNIAEARQAHDRTADILQRLTLPLHPGVERTYVLGVRENCIAAVTVDSRMAMCLDLSFGLTRQPLDDTSFLLSTPEDPSVDKVHQDEPAKVVSAPLGAAEMTVQRLPGFEDP